MKSVRIWFKKDFECRYISHLDLNRCMLRALHKSKIPIWHTEGFNPHPFATFPLPLSLGFRGVNECMDVKLEDESFPFEEIISRLNGCLPRGLRVFDVTEPVMKAGKIAFASFTIKISCDGENSRTVCEQLNELLTSESIEVEKKSKKGRVYYGCEHNPECDFVSWDMPAKEKCPKCGSYMVEKGKNPVRLLCSNEKCGYTEEKKTNDEE